MGSEILVLGGAGDMGSRTVEDLRDSGLQVIVADRAGGAGVLALDVRDRAALVEAMREARVVASAVGPFFRFEHAIVEAALQADVDYVSICDEWDVAEAVTMDFGERARKQGRRVVLGAGASPGITNMLAALLAEEVAPVDSIDINVFLPSDAGGGEAAYRHLLHILTGQCGVWRGGRRATIRSCSESTGVRLPLVGRRRTWAMGHSEPITLGPNLGVRGSVDFRMGFGPVTGLLVLASRSGLLDLPGAADRLARLLVRVERHLGSSPGTGSFRVDAVGRSSATALGTGNMRDATGLALSVGARMLAHGEVTDTTGVLATEQVYDPRRFLTLLQERGLEGWRDLACTQALLA